MSIEVKDFEKQFMCCGKRMVLMPNYTTHPEEVRGTKPVWTLGCADCDLYTDHGPMDNPIFIISDVYEIGGN